jgi:nitroimidazol reductase NimA-like FMN-containing flavoprotein (pyridoxamine 5'-phosphate oxidase superfamily)
VPTNDSITPARPLTQQEIADLTSLAIPAHLATLDPVGFPRVIPIWFLWEEGIFYLSSGPQSRHVQDLARDPRAGLCITVEESQTETGYRPFRQIMVRGYAYVQPDTDASWAQKLISKYIPGEAGAQRAKQEAEKPHMVIALRPERFLTTGFFPANESHLPISKMAI